MAQVIEATEGNECRTLHKNNNFVSLLSRTFLKLVSLKTSTPNVNGTSYYKVNEQLTEIRPYSWSHTFGLLLIFPTLAFTLQPNLSIRVCDKIKTQYHTPNLRNVIFSVVSQSYFITYQITIRNHRHAEFKWEIVVYLDKFLGKFSNFLKSKKHSIYLNMNL